MKNLILKIVFLTFSVLLVISCSSDDNDGNVNGATLLKEYDAITMGWGKGKANKPGYLSLSVGEGQIQTFSQINDNDEDTQSLVDIVFPGDWGSQGGGITIAAPTDNDASYEYCTNWLRKKGTQIADLPNSFDLSSFENVKTVQQIKALESEYALYYSGWDYPLGTGQGKTYLIRTYEGYLALVYLQSVQGTYGDLNAKVTLRIKLTEETF